MSDDSIPPVTEVIRTGTRVFRDPIIPGDPRTLEQDGRETLTEFIESHNEQSGTPLGRKD